MHLKSDNKEVKINDKADQVIENPLKSLLNRYQNSLEASVRGKGFVFDCVHLLYYKCHKINPNHGGSYIDPPYWIKNKKATINPINERDNKCFQYAITVALNHEEIEKHSERITNIKPFTNKYTWEEINFPSEKDYWKNFEKNNLTNAFNVLHAKKEKI